MQFELLLEKITVLELSQIQQRPSTSKSLATKRWWPPLYVLKTLIEEGMGACIYESAIDLCGGEGGRVTMLEDVPQTWRDSREKQ